MKSIAIVATTYYPKWYQGKLRSIKHTDKIRGDLALEFIKKSIAKGCQTVIVDGKSSHTFRHELKNIKECIIIRRRSAKRSPAKRQGIKRAVTLQKVQVIVLTEPEKISLITDCLDTLVYPIISQEADIVIPKRNNILFKKTYPKYMYESEIEGNILYNNTLHASGLLHKNDPDLDMFFGPRIFANQPKVVSLFMKKFVMQFSKKPRQIFFDADEYSNVGFFPIIIAIKKKYRIKSVEVPFIYPKIQKQNEEIGSRELFLEKRKNQRLGLLIELQHFVQQRYVGK